MDSGIVTLPLVIMYLSFYIFYLRGRKLKEKGELLNQCLMFYVPMSLLLHMSRCMLTFFKADLQKEGKSKQAKICYCSS